MNKISRDATNDFCPQTLMLYGTYRSDGTPNFALFTWMSYYWNAEDNALGFMAAIGEPKLTLDRIRQTGMFSANLVTEELLPLADKLGNTSGYSPEKAAIPLDTEPGVKLPVPILKASPVNFELEVKEHLPHGEGAVLLCAIRNVQYAPYLADKSLSVEERARRVRTVRSVTETYFGWDGRVLGRWGEPQRRL